jgi:hypothetical protein
MFIYETHRLHSIVVLIGMNGVVLIGMNGLTQLSQSRVVKDFHSRSQRNEDICTNEVTERESYSQYHTEVTCARTMDSIKSGLED